jgi:hypothetical protein
VGRETGRDVVFACGTLSASSGKIFDRHQTHGPKAANQLLAATASRARVLLPRIANPERAHIEIWN